MAKVVLVRPGQGQNSGRGAGWVGTSYLDVVEIRYGIDVHVGKKGTSVSYPSSQWGGLSPEAYLRQLVERKLNEGKGYVMQSEDWSRATTRRDGSASDGVEPIDELSIALNDAHTEEALDVVTRLEQACGLKIARSDSGPHVAAIEVDGGTVRLARTARQGGGTAASTKPAALALFCALAARCDVPLTDRDNKFVDPRALARASRGQFSPEQIATLESLCVLQRAIDWSRAFEGTTFFA